MKTRVTGLDNMRKRCRQVRRRMARATDDEASRIAEDIRVAAVEVAPKDSGYLASKIEVRRDPDGGYLVGLWPDGFGDDFYPVYVEYGTSDTPAKPFMIVAYTSEAGEAERMASLRLAAEVRTI